MGWYDTSQVCLNGHVITDNATSSPEFMQKYCSECGEPTIITCPECKTKIRGEYQVEGALTIRSSTPIAPLFCHECGKPYPWTLRKINAAKELGDELDDLSVDEKKKLKSSLDDLIIDTPKTEIAIVRFKKLMSKVGKESYGAMKAIIIDIVSESVRKAIFGN